MVSRTKVHFILQKVIFLTKAIGESVTDLQKTKSEQFWTTFGPQLAAVGGLMYSAASWARQTGGQRPLAQGPEGTLGLAQGGGLRPPAQGPEGFCERSVKLERQRTTFRVVNQRKKRC